MPRRTLQREYLARLAATPELSPMAYAVGQEIAFQHGRDLIRPQTHLTYARIGRRIRRSRQSVQRAMTELRELGLIETERRYRRIDDAGTVHQIASRFRFPDDLERRRQALRVTIWPTDKTTDSRNRGSQTSRHSGASSSGCEL